MHIAQRFRNSWLRMPIDRKVRLLGGMFPAAIALTVAFYLFSLNAGYADIGESYSHIVRSLTAEEAMRQEKAALETYLRNRSDNSYEALESAIVHTESSISLLPDTYSEIGAERFARTRNIRNAYSSYEADRQNVCALDPDLDSTIDAMYQVYQEADYLESYLQDLTEVAVEQGSRSFESRSDVVRSLPFLVVLAALVLALLTAHVWNWFSRFLVVPIQKLVQAVRQIGRGDFSGEDVAVANLDELGELTEAVNKMKHGMETNITTLVENQKLSERLYEEERNRLETEKALESARLDLLQARINPHFLFNTLNVIGGMAELEGAETTEKMTRSLSAIFRYNLHTTAQMVTLSQELQVIRDYMYLQKMRFGARLSYEEDTEGVDTDAVMVPVFLLQPIVENAVIHGTSRKVEGGKVVLSVQKEAGDLMGPGQARGSGENVVITVSDTGVGMSREDCAQLMESLKNDGNVSSAKGDHAGVGLRNVYERVMRIYPGGEMKMEAEEGHGMTVRIVLPQGRGS